MGVCMNKIRNNHTGGANKTLGLPVVHRRPSVQKNDEFESSLPTKRQLQYWERRLAKICGHENNFISQRNMRQMFSYFGFGKDSIKKLHEVFKSEKEILDSARFYEGLTKFGSGSSQQLAILVYQIYFDSLQNSALMVPRFCQQFSRFLKKQKLDDLSASNKLTKNGTNENKKIKQLQSYLDERKAIEDSNDVEKWIIKNVNFRFFKIFFLEGGLRQDEKQAFQSFWVDFNSIEKGINVFSSGLDKQQKRQVAIINWRWCERMLRYFNQKYEINGVPLLKKKSQNNQSILWENKMRRKQSVNQMMVKSSTNQNIKHVPNDFAIEGITHNRMITTQISSPLKNQINFSNIKVTDKLDEVYYESKIHPGRIDNSSLMGNFKWQLKRNLWKNVDYITIKLETYQKLMLCFGGSLELKRKIFQGYIELRPYFIITYLFSFDKSKNKAHLEEEQLVKVSLSDYVSSILTEKTKTHVCYHRNIGGQWQKYSYDNPENKGKKVVDVFTETSFFVYMPLNFEKQFTDFYVQKDAIERRPDIGQTYESKTFNILNLKFMEQDVQDAIEVCIIDNQDQQNYVKFVVLNAPYHVQRKITLSDFKKNFISSNNKSQSLHYLKHKSRAGISNLGNTCYMNASLQALLCTIKDEHLNSLKGQLAIELRQIARKTRQNKKAVFPIDFKTVFDQHYAYFKGQQQHDAHEFCICLFEQLEEKNRNIIKKILQFQVKEFTTCPKCLKVQQKATPNFIVELPLRNFQKQQVKIDYITDNKTISTITFPIQKQSSVADWKHSFEKVSGAKDYFLCEIQNCLITRTFNSQDGLDNESFKNLRIENHFLILAYETRTIKSHLKIKEQYDYRTYKDANGKCYVARVQQDVTQTFGKSLRDTNSENIDTTVRRYKIIMKGNHGLEDKIVPSNELFNFPEDFPYQQIYVKVLNYDRTFNQKIGRPFIFRFPSHYPLSVVRQALQSCIGKKGYFLRAAPFNEPFRCQICKRNSDTNSQCFIKRQSFSPLCWVDGVIQFVAVWDNIHDYNQTVKRVKPSQSKIKKAIKQEQFDNLELCLKKFQEKELIQIQKCDLCNATDIEIEHAQKLCELPQILILHLKRFTISKGEIIKIHTKWKLEETIFIHKKKYILKAVLCHVGTGADFGHYVTIADGIRYDDELLTKTSFQNIAPDEIYMLFYVKAQA